MIETKYTKRINSIKEMYQRINERNLEDLNKAIQYDDSLQFIIKRISKLEKQISNMLESDKERLNKLKAEIKLEIKKNVIYIINELNSDYQLNISINDYSENDIYNKGMLSVLNQSGLLSKIYESILNDILPKHPKDEYKSVRSTKRKFFIHCGPTNSGKTYEAIQRLKESQSGAYLSPLRLLALEIYEKLNLEFTPTNLLTGEEEVNVPFATHTSSTIEKANFNKEYDVVVIDECQMIQDKQRGNAWTRAILGIKAKEIHLICAEHTVNLLKNIITDCGDEFEIIEYKRRVPLEVENDIFAFPYSINKGDALIVFSRKQVIKIAEDLKKHNIKSSMIYGNLPPDTRRKQIDLFIEGSTDVIVSTDAIGMGLNLPIQRVVFLESEKFDGFNRRLLNTQEIKQIAGRAGRQGLYDKGFVNSLENKEYIKNTLLKEEADISKATLSPMDSTILSLPIGTLSDKLITWNKYKIDIPYIQKIDISEQIVLLHHIERYSNVLGDDVLLKCIMIPFNQRNEDVLRLWLDYVNTLAKKNKSLQKPFFRTKTLFDLESYYNQINLYYSFSDKFNLKFDYKWVTKERQRVSEEIHQLIKQQKYK